jgi:hypothetical protein
MYEKIFDIIENHLFKTKISIAGKDVLANEIDILTYEHYMEFAEWVYLNVNFIFDELPQDFEKIYQYWLTRARDKLKQ